MHMQDTELKNQWSDDCCIAWKFEWQQEMQSFLLPISLLNISYFICYIQFLVIIFLFIWSHRPLDLDNVYNQDQVKIMIKEGDTFDEIPEFDKVYESQVILSKT